MSVNDLPLSMIVRMLLLSPLIMWPYATLCSYSEMRQGHMMREEVKEEGCLDVYNDRFLPIL